MRFEGREVHRYTGTVHIAREISPGEWEDMQIRVQALPSTWNEEAARQLPQPDPSEQNVKEKQPDGTWKNKTNEGSPEHREAMARWTNLRAAKRIYDATVDDRIQWETDPEIRKTNPAEFYARILNELCGAFSAEEVMSWSAKILSLGYVAGSDIVEAEDQFFRIFERLAKLSIGEEDGLDEGGVLAPVHGVSDAQGMGDSTVGV